MADLVISLFILAGLALAVGAFVLLRRGLRQKGLLMAAAALLMFANAAIWLIPTGSGASLANPQGYNTP